MPEAVQRAGTIFTEISLQDHIRGWRRQKERTGSVRTAPGLSDHIVATYHKGMAKFDRLLRQIPYAAGFLPAAYQKISDFAILKKAGVLDVELIRTIQLMVAAFNINNKHTGQTIMQRAESLQILPPDQYGPAKAKGPSSPISIKC
jgi:hypothetical protein